MLVMFRCLITPWIWWISSADLCGFYSFILFLWQVNLEIDVKGSFHPKLTVVDEAKAIGAYHVVLDSLVSVSPKWFFQELQKMMLVLVVVSVVPTATSAAAEIDYEVEQTQV